MIQKIPRTHIRPDKCIVLIECACLLVAFGTYMYFVTVSVAEAVIRNELVLDIRETEARVGELESAYFIHLDALTPSMLEEYDLVTVAPVAYVSVDADGGRLTRRD